jgi:hypothetical protein
MSPCKTYSFLNCLLCVWWHGWREVGDVAQVIIQLTWGHTVRQTITWEALMVTAQRGRQWCVWGPAVQGREWHTDKSWLRLWVQCGRPTHVCPAWNDIRQYRSWVNEKKTQFANRNFTNSCICFNTRALQQPAAKLLTVLPNSLICD